jgi:PHD/YefM family antitoxin component YafN of YafNO toxin-antitoxin module
MPQAVAVAEHGRPVVEVMSEEEFEWFKAVEGQARSPRNK